MNHAIFGSRFFFFFLTPCCGGDAVHAAPRPLPEKLGTEGVAGVEAGALGGAMVPCIGGREGGSLAGSG